MVYGFESCKYQEVISELMQSSQVRFVFDYHLGNKSDDQAFEVSPPISQIDTSRRGAAQDPCKAALVNLVFENYKRSKAGKPLIPVLFTIDCEKNLYPVTAESATTKKTAQNSKITFKEIRRAYKLCEEISDPELRAIARETFKFVKVNNDLSLELIAAPWNDKNWPTLWAERRKASKKSSRSKPSWEKQLYALKETHLKKMEKPTRSSSSCSMESSSSGSSLLSSRMESSTSGSSLLSCRIETITRPVSTTLDSSPVSPTSSSHSPSSYLRRTFSERPTTLEKLFTKAL
jgi:hypothetical protein